MTCAKYKPVNKVAPVTSLARLAVTVVATIYSIVSTASSGLILLRLMQGSEVSMTAALPVEPVRKLQHVFRSISGEVRVRIGPETPKFEASAVAPQ